MSGFPRHDRVEDFVQLTFDPSDVFVVILVKCFSFRVDPSIHPILVFVILRDVNETTFLGNNERNQSYASGDPGPDDLEFRGR